MLKDLYVMKVDAKQELDNMNDLKDIARFKQLILIPDDNVRIIGSIRNEVINSVKTKGKEINKAIESYGIPIDWTQYSEESLRHPLIKLLINYFRISDVISGRDTENDDAKEYDRWVSPNMLGAPSEETIRNFTLYRPRHVVRFLNISKIRCGTHEKITETTFNRIKRQYSLECWNEITEDLALSYTPKELELIKEWLTGMPWRTNYNAMYDRARLMWKEQPGAEKLFLRFDDLMRDLYQSGVIGNYHRNGGKGRPSHRWHFRGDETLLKHQDIQIHRIFQTVLSTVSPNSSL